MALIPLYLPNHSVEVAKSNRTRMLSVFHLSCFFQIILVTDIWAINYYTNHLDAQTRAVIQANKQALATSVSQTLKMSKIEKSI
jgi:hypothetical protein